MGRSYNGLYYLHSYMVRNHGLNLYLRQKIYYILCPPIKLGMAFLTAKTLHLTYCQSMNP